MKSSDRTIFIGLGVLGLLAAFWFLVLSPKRDEASALGEKITELESSVAAQEQLAAAGETAQANFDGNYRSLVVLGKAVPEGEDTSSLFVQLDELSERAKTRLSLIELTKGAGTAPAPTPTAETTVDGATPTQTSGEPAPATETAAAALPLGATVGPAGLPVMPYSLRLSGSYFQVAEFLDGLDKLVRLKGGAPDVDGRLLTIDGFSLTPSATVGSETLDINVIITSYVSPADQGLTAGATPAGPASAVPASTTTPAATPTPTPTPTATVTP